MFTEKRKMGIYSLSLALVLAGVVACSKEVKSKANFIFKPAPDQSTAFELNGKKYTKAEVFKGIESDIFDLEQKIFDAKMNKIRSFLLEKFMKDDPRKKGLTNDQFLEKFISNQVKITDKEINDFIAERKIPKEHQTAEIKQKIENYLAIGKKKEAVQNWINQKTAKSPVNIFIQKPQRPVFDVVVGDSPTFGGKDAKVTIVEFSDFQCPFCAKAVDVLKELKSKYGDKIQVAFRNFPLPFHSHAKIAAVAGLCAREQGDDKFWKMHDTMFANQHEKLDKGNLKNLAKKIGLDSGKFDSCLDSEKYMAKVEEDMKYGQEVGVKSTPTFFVNGQLVNGAQSLEVFSEIIDSQLAL